MSAADTVAEKRGPSVWTTLRTLLPHVWKYRTRVIAALVLLTLAKLANIGVPLVLKRMVDHLDLKLDLLTVPALLLLTYGALRLSATLFQELRGVVFARVLARTARGIALEVFEHLHALSLRFHLDRSTGAVSRDLERGSSAISDLLDS
jgi:ATP-binding cassette subfamily B protein